MYAYERKIKRNSGNGYQKPIGIFLAIASCLCSVQNSTAQQPDSSATKTPPAGSEWAVRPPSGSSEKTQGLIFGGFGSAMVVLGLIRLSEEDPCEDLGGAYTFCTSNIDEVHAFGATAAGIGIGSIIYGIIKYSDGSKKEKKYKEWKIRQAFSVMPFLDLRRRNVKLIVAF